MSTILQKLYMAMIEFYDGDPKRIQHFVKVHSFAKLICNLENVDEKTTFITEVAALVHDIGIRVSERKFGKSNGKLQEQEGPLVAKQMLESLGFQPEVIDRVCFLVGHHHTYSSIDNIDYQILVEADFLVNFYEDEIPVSGIKTAISKIFKNQSAIKIANTMFKLD
jgi:uncharacterized protein